MQNLHFLKVKMRNIKVKKPIVDNKNSFKDWIWFSKKSERKNIRLVVIETKLSIDRTKRQSGKAQKSIDFLKTNVFKTHKPSAFNSNHKQVIFQLFSF